MTRAGSVFSRSAAAGAALVAAGAVAACGSSPAPSVAATGSGVVATGSMVTSVATPAESWAVVPIAADPAFWQVFARTANSASWRLVTPPGVAINGGIVASAEGTGSLTVAVRPSDHLTFSPLAATTDGGASWSIGGPINAAVAASPGALSVFDSKLVALLSSGAIEASANAGATWSTLAAPGAIAASAAAKGCGGSVRVTTVSFGPTGTEVLAGGTCGTGGTGAMFSYSAGSGWQRVSLPVSGQLVRATDEMALVLGKSGLTALWQESSAAGASGSSWITSAALPVSGAVIASGDLAVPGVPSALGKPAGSGALNGVGAWVLMSGERAATIAAPGQTSSAAPRWVTLPTVPANTSVLASGPDGAVDALAVSGATLTVWRLSSDATTWSKVQAITVPIQYGSSS